MTTGGKPRESREPIEAVDAKFEEIQKALGFGTPTALMNAAIDRFPAARLNRREFQRQVFEDKRMNSTYQQCLGEFSGFDWTSQQWKHGTCSEFLDYWGKLRGGSALVEDARFVDPEKKCSDLAMLTLFAPTNAPAPGPGRTYISFVLNCPKLADAGFECGVQAGWLEFDLGNASTTHARDRKGFGEGAAINNARLSVHDPDFHKPSWRVEAVNGKWIGMVVDVPADFLLVENLAHGNCVRAQFRVCVSEIGVSFALPDHVKSAKSKLKRRLTTLQILGDDDGKATVAAISIRLKAKPKPEEDPSRDQ